MENTGKRLVVSVIVFIATTLIMSYLLSSLNWYAWYSLSVIIFISIVWLASLYFMIVEFFEWEIKRE